MPHPVLEELKNLSEDAYKDFNTKIIPTRQAILGVRMPALRKIAKKIAKQNPVSFIQSDKPEIHELILLEGLVLSYMDAPFSALLPCAEAFLKKVDNWAQVDSTVADFGNFDTERPEILEAAKAWLVSDNAFFVRAGLVILLARFVEKQDLDMVFRLSQQVRHSDYYVRMANAWLISVCMAKFPAETTEFFRQNSLDKFTHNKAIQKSRESYRVSKKDKEFIRTLKRP